MTTNFPPQYVTNENTQVPRMDFFLISLPNIRSIAKTYFRNYYFNKLIH